MHYVGYAEMAAAVSNAGGLGVITALTVAQPPRGAEVRTHITITNLDIMLFENEVGIFIIIFYPNRSPPHCTAPHPYRTPTAPLPHRSHGPACETAVYLRFSTRSRLFYLVSQYVILISVTPSPAPPMLFFISSPLFFLHGHTTFLPSFLPSFLPYTNQLQNKGLA